MARFFVAWTINVFSRQKNQITPRARTHRFKFIVLELSPERTHDVNIFSPLIEYNALLHFSIIYKKLRIKTKTLCIIIMKKRETRARVSRIATDFPPIIARGRVALIWLATRACFIYLAMVDRASDRSDYFYLARASERFCESTRVSTVLLLLPRLRYRKRICRRESITRAPPPLSLSLARCSLSVTAECVRLLLFTLDLRAKL